jgi:ubiquinone/menaquinone biosynthesis C-methylase UbiE
MWTMVPEKRCSTYEKCFSLSDKLRIPEQKRLDYCNSQFERTIMVKQKSIVVRFFDWCFKSPLLRRMIWGRIYQLLIKFYPNQAWVFMNYGYTANGPDYSRPDLESGDEHNRYFIQLYEHILGKQTLTDKHVLEVGSGRGGGISYLARYHKPKQCIGMDYSKNAVTFCSARHKVSNLSFQVGDAEDLPFEGESFDAIVNVESSHCYNMRTKFFHEVKRVLRPGGFFFYTDVVDSDRLQGLQKELRSTELEICKEEDISRNVMQALEEDGERRYTLFRKTMHPLALHFFKEFAGNRTSEMYRKIKDGLSVYYHYILRKKLSNADRSENRCEDRIAAPEYTRENAAVNFSITVPNPME